MKKFLKSVYTHIENKNTILCLAYLYLIIPFVIFLFGWVRLELALPIFIILCICYYKMIHDETVTALITLRKKDIPKIVFVISMFALWVYFSGIGKFVFQNTDHTIRNGIFNILVEYDWPVVNTIIDADKMPGAEATSIIYYIGFWLPSAIIGKVFGLRAGYYAQAVWALLGISLVYYFVCCYLKKIQIWPAFLFMFWSGLDIVGQYLTTSDLGNISSTLHLEWWAIPYEYSGMTTQLFWVFNQAIPIWLCTILILLQCNNRYRVFILSLSMITSTIPFIGLFAMLIFLIVTTHENKNTGSIWNNIKTSFSFANICGGGSVGIISFLYLSLNLAGTHIMQQDTRGPMYAHSLPKYVLFILIEIGFYIVLLYKFEHNNKLFYFVIIWLVICPLVKIGYGNDFCMRASIPALFILMLYTMKALMAMWKNHNIFFFRTLLIVCILGGMTSLWEIKRTMSTTFERINNGEIVYERDEDPIYIFNTNTFSGIIDDSIFFKYIAK